MQAQGFFALVVVGWLAVCGLLAVTSGWRSLAQRFPATGPIRGEHFRFVSATMGTPWFPVRYTGCLFITVGDAGLGLSVFFPFRFLSPQLLIPWTQVEALEERAGLFGGSVVLRVKNAAVALTLFGQVATSVVAAHAQARARDAR